MVVEDIPWRALLLACPRNRPVGATLVVARTTLVVARAGHAGYPDTGRDNAARRLERARRGRTRRPAPAPTAPGLRAPQLHFVPLHGADSSARPLRRCPLRVRVRRKVETPMEHARQRSSVRPKPALAA